MRPLILLGLAGLCAAAPLDAQDATPAPKPHKAANPNKKICRSSNEITSRIPRTECRTQAEWNTIDATSTGNGTDSLDMSRTGSAR